MPRSARLLAASWLVLAPTALVAQDAAKFYEDNCSACHTIGSGAPPLDLKGVTSRADRAWLVRFMLDPATVLKSGDPYAAQILKAADGMEMPATEGLTPEMAEAILKYLDAQDAAAAPADSPEAVPEPAVSPAPSPESIARGRELFLGSRRLESGGPSCLACHRVGGLDGWNGGRLGPDLTTLADRLRGPSGVTKWLSNPPTPVMKAVYRSAPLADAERDALASFFAHPAHDTAPSAPSRVDLQFAGAGVLGAFAAAGMFGLVWRRRFRGVRRSFVEDARRRVRGEQR